MSLIDRYIRWLGEASGVARLVVGYGVLVALALFIALIIAILGWIA